MFYVTSSHICSVKKKSSQSYLPKLPPDAGVCSKARRWLKKLMLISEINPRSLEYYRSSAEIMEERKKQVESGNWVIHPFSTFQCFYEMWMMVVFFCCMIYKPLNAGFDKLMHLPKFRVINNILNVACIVDIILRFCSGYGVRKQKMVIMEPNKIAVHYVISIHFVADVLSSIPEFPSIFPNYTAWRVINIFGLLKWTRLPTMFKYMRRTADFFKVRNFPFLILKLLINVYFMYHYLACLFILTPQCRLLITGKYAANSSLKHLLELDGIGQQYTKSYYWASAHMLAININRDHQPGTWEDFIVRTSAYLLGKVFTLYVVVLVMDMLTTNRALEVKYCATISQVHSYMRAKKMPVLMQQRILQYYKYKYNNKYFRERTITSFFSEHLKREITMHVFKKLVQNVKIFENLPRRLLEEILSCLVSEIYMPNDIIIKAMTLGDCMYFLASGTVAVTTPLGKEVCHLKDGAYFGEISLVLSNKRRSANVIAIEICEVYKLNRKSFKKCFNKHPDLLKKILELAVQRNEEIEAMEVEVKRRYTRVQRHSGRFNFR